MKSWSGKCVIIFVVSSSVSMNSCFYFLGTSVNILNPCIPCISSLSAWFTSWCCCTVLFPLNSFDSICTSYMAPQPPEISTTLTDVACGKLSFRICVILTSPFVRDDINLCTQLNPKTYSFLRRNLESDIIMMLRWWQN